MHGEKFDEVQDIEQTGSTVRGALPVRDPSANEPQHKWPAE